MSIGKLLMKEAEHMTGLMGDESVSKAAKTQNSVKSRFNYTLLQRAHQGIRPKQNDDGFTEQHELK